MASSMPTKKSTIVNKFGTGFDQGTSINYLSDGSIVVGGFATISNNYDYVLVKYNADGSRNSSFGNNGVALTSFSKNTLSENNDIATSTAVLNDGSILIAGKSYIGSGFAFAVAKYKNNGTLDTNFGTAGKAITQISGSTSEASFMAIQPDNKIIVGGFAYTGSFSTAFALARYTPNGTLDPTFGDHGTIVTSINNYFNNAYACTILDDGRILVAGTSKTGPLASSDNNIAIACYQTNGSLDSNFGNNGVISTEIGYDIYRTNDICNSAITLKNNTNQGKILIAGSSDNTPSGDTNFLLIRYNTDGSIDQNFGQNGIVSTDFGGNDTASKIIELNNGSILAIGYTYNNSGANGDIAIAKYNPDGSLDSSFGNGNGKIIYNTGGDESIYGATLDNNGNILVTGSTTTTASSTNYDLLVAKFSSTGAPIESFIATNSTSTNHPPVIQKTLGNYSIPEKTTLTYTIDPNQVFKDSDGDLLTLSAVLKTGNLPSWITFDNNTNKLTIAPTNSDVGSYPLQIIATDPYGATATCNVTLTVTNVNDAPYVNIAASNQTATQNKKFSYQLDSKTFIDIDKGDTLSYIATMANNNTLPNWLKFDASKLTFSGTPANADVGTLDIKVTATDKAKASSSTNFSLNVLNINDQPTTTGKLADQTATQEQLFSYSVNTIFMDIDIGDTLTYTAKQAIGNTTKDLPNWLNFSTNQVNGKMVLTFTGTPHNSDVTASNIKIQITATDSGNLSANSQFSLSVANVNDAPIVNNVIDKKTTTELQKFSFTIPSNTFKDPDTGDTLTLSAALQNNNALQSLPKWLSFDSKTNTLSGTPQDGDTGGVIVITAKDKGGLSTSTNFTLSINDINQTPVFNSTKTFSSNTLKVTEGTAFSIPLPTGIFSDPDKNDILNYSVSNNPPWLSIDPKSGALSGTPSFDSAATSSFTITANDGHGGTVAHSFTLTITNTLTINGTHANDTLIAGDGNDTIYGNDGNDYIAGGAGNDSLLGGNGNDSISGGAGNDKLQGGAGVDTLTGGDGADTFILSTSSAGGITGSQPDYNHHQYTLTGKFNTGDVLVYGNYSYTPDIYASYEVKSGDTLSDITQGITTAINNTLHFTSSANNDSVILGESNNLSWMGIVISAYEPDSITDFSSGTDKIQISAAELNNLLNSNPSGSGSGDNPMNARGSVKAYYSTGNKGDAIAFRTFDAKSSDATANSKAGSFIYDAVHSTLILDQLGNDSWVNSGDTLVDPGKDDIVIAIVGTVAASDITIVA